MIFQRILYHQLNYNTDYVLIYRTVQSEHDHTILQQDLNKLQEWANAWLISFNPQINPSKCEMIHINNKKNPIYIRIVGNYLIRIFTIRFTIHDHCLGYAGIMLGILIVAIVLF